QQAVERLSAGSRGISSEASGMLEHAFGRLPNREKRIALEGLLEHGQAELFLACSGSAGFGRALTSLKDRARALAGRSRPGGGQPLSLSAFHGAAQVIRGDQGIPCLGSAAREHPTVRMFTAAYDQLSARDRPAALQALSEAGLVPAYLACRARD